MSLFAAGKCCLDCSRVEDPGSKASIREYMFNHFSLAVAYCSEDVDMEVCSDEDLLSLKFFIKELEVACYHCDGTSRKIFEKIEKNYVMSMEKKIKEAIEEEKEEIKKIKSEKKKTRKGNVLEFRSIKSKGT